MTPYWVMLLDMGVGYQRLTTVNSFCKVNDQKLIQNQLYNEFEAFWQHSLLLHFLNGKGDDE